MAVESLILLPVSSFYLIFTEVGGSACFLAAGTGMKLLFITTGIVTVVPLVLFAKGTSRIPLTLDRLSSVSRSHHDAVFRHLSLRGNYECL